MNNSRLINQTSGLVEYYTDPRIVEAAREVMGGIDLDPASCKYANDNFVKARCYYSLRQEDDSACIGVDGLSHHWFGKLFLNHPFSKGEKACVENCKKKRCDPVYKDYPEKQRPTGWRGFCIKEDIPGNSDWINRLIDEYDDKSIDQACSVAYNVASETWFQPLIKHPICFLYPRTNYYLADGTKTRQNTKGSVVTYLGDNVAVFKYVFQEKHKLGTVKI